MVVYAYGDCLALAFKTKEDNSPEKQEDPKARHDLLPSIHGREIMACLGLSKGQFLITGSEDTTFKVLKADCVSQLQVN